jgi:hypothetical protein
MPAKVERLKVLLQKEVVCCEGADIQQRYLEIGNPVAGFIAIHDDTVTEHLEPDAIFLC